MYGQLDELYNFHIYYVDQIPMDEEQHAFILACANRACETGRKGEMGREMGRERRGYNAAE